MNLHRTYLVCLAALFAIIFVVKMTPTMSLPHFLTRAASGVVEASSSPAHVEVTAQEPSFSAYPYAGQHLIVHLALMNIELRDGTTTLATLPIITIGKPGSYYETIGGVYQNDYKIRNHFSSIGHVYMPWSTHVFGNFFIHGIPYYENGTKVSGEYSGGCIRLTDADAKRVYDFISKETPIIVTDHSVEDFAPLATSSIRITSMDMTRLMAATISLEVLTQDDPIFDPTTKTTTTRRKLLPRLIEDKDDRVIGVLAISRGDATFLDYMNTKARSLGLTNTHFSAINEPAETASPDMERFLAYIQNYKTYLLTLGTSTPLVSQ